MNEQVSSAGRVGLSGEVYSLLAQANLLRMRGCWEEATENCMAALRLTPDSHSAQSLLGDIYENQGRRDDAIQWYRMALDLNPHSPADRMKLERLLDLQRDAGPLSLEPDDNSRDTLGVQRARPWVLPRPELALRVASLAAALFVLAVLVAAYVSVHRRAALSVLGFSSTQEVKTPLVVLHTADSPPAAPVASDNARDASDQAVLEALRSSPDLSASGISVYDVQTDPRTARLTLSFGAAPGPSGVLNREAVSRSALRLVQAASALPGAQTTALFTVRCLTTPPSGSVPPSASLVFVGDVSRDAIPTTELSLSPAQVQALFGSPWWSPQLAG